jgi:HK97 family phage prohead protease
MSDWKRLLDDNARRALEVFERRCGTFGDLERRSLPFTDGEIEIRDSGEGPDAYTVKGHAAVFNRKSLDLGGFQEIIAPGAFDNVLDRNPHVLLLWDHDTRYQLASTKTNRLELRVDPRGLYFWARVVGSTSHARDLRYLMDAGEVDQASFAFTVARDTWEIKNEGKDKETVLRTIEEVAELYDVTVTAMGAYPQTDTSVVRAYALNYAADSGRLDTEEDRESPGSPRPPRTPPPTQHPTTSHRTSRWAPTESRRTRRWTTRSRTLTKAWAASRAVTGTARRRRRRCCGPRASALTRPRSSTATS